MATQQQIEDLLTSVGTVGQVMADLSAERAKLQGYRDVRQQYADLVATQKALVDNLITSSEAALRDLATKISAVFPASP